MPYDRMWKIWGIVQILMYGDAAVSDKMGRNEARSEGLSCRFEFLLRTSDRAAGYEICTVFEVGMAVRAFDTSYNVIWTL
jgi:hypothetical protein